MSIADGLDLNVLFGDRDAKAADISRLYTQMNSARSGILDFWTEVLRYVYATSTKDTTNEQVTDWSNTTHRPKMANLFDTLTINYDAALFPNDDWLEWKGGDAESASKKQAKTVEAYMKTKHKLKGSNFRQVMRQLEEDWVLFGNAFCQVDWVREFTTNPDTGEITLGYVGPKPVRIDPRSIVMNPLASSFRAAPKIIRTLYTVADLHRIVQENPDKAYFADILEVATTNRGRIHQFDQGDVDRDLQLQCSRFLW
jgi:hypothetical protein